MLLLVRAFAHTCNRKVYDWEVGKDINGKRVNGKQLNDQWKNEKRTNEEWGNEEWLANILQLRDSWPRIPPTLCSVPQCSNATRKLVWIFQPYMQTRGYQKWFPRYFIVIFQNKLVKVSKTALQVF